MMASGGPRPEPGTLNALLLGAMERFDRPDAFMYKSAEGGEYLRISHRDFLSRVRHLALALRDQGVSRGDRVAILSENRPEWAVCDLAALMHGLVSVPVYPSIPAAQVAHILRDSGACVVFASDASQVAKLVEIRALCPDVRLIVTFGDGGTRADGSGAADTTLAQLLARGAELDSAGSAAAFRAEALSAEPSDLATIIYTSGTTGRPKGVMLTHDNLHSNVVAARSIIDFHEDVSLSILPLSHVFERMAGHYLMISVGAAIAYAESVDAVARNMTEVRPTFVLSVPRLYEKIYARVLENARGGGALKWRIFQWAQGVSGRWADVKLAGGEPRGLLALQYAIADRLVFSKLRARTGGRLRLFVSGGAPLSPALNKFFYSAGLLILEGYGLTETSPVLCVNTPGELRIGTVGKPIPGVEIRIADDGEILARGPGVMTGYYNNPDATAEVLSADGWFHTGDIGVLEDGFLRITDRKKDIIVTAGGKNVAPQAIENAVKGSEFVAEAVMIGDRRKYVVMLIVPDFARLERWCAERGIPVGDRAELIRRSEVEKKMEEEVFARTAGLASFESPKKVALLPNEFSIDKGELTPSMKVKRRVIDEHYSELIESLYEADG